MTTGSPTSMAPWERVSGRVQLVLIWQPAWQCALCCIGMQRMALPWTIHMVAIIDVSAANQPSPLRVCTLLTRRRIQTVRRRACAAHSACRKAACAQHSCIHFTLLTFKEKVALPTAAAYSRAPKHSADMAGSYGGVPGVQIPSLANAQAALFTIGRAGAALPDGMAMLLCVGGVAVALAGCFHRVCRGGSRTPAHLSSRPSC